MRLFIAEKPKMAQAIAAHLPGPHLKKDGYIETGGGWVSWCVGHVLEQKMPEDYNEKWSKWDLADLPIVPPKWEMKVSESTKKQTRILQGLIKSCSEVVNAGDPGREGQLIVDEVLEFFNNKKPVLRISLNALDGPSVKKALAALEPNSKYQNLYQAALGRQRADWLMGINLTRLYTVLGRKYGYPGVLSVGRVQTPTLRIVVERDLEIENFVPRDFWTVKVQFVDPAQAALPFWASWVVPGKVEETAEGEDDDEEQAQGRPEWVDGKGRIFDQAQAQRIARAGLGGPAKIALAEKKPAKEAAPLPYELTKLQSVMDARFGMGAKETLEACQSLYEKGFTSYPRTDCPYLPTSQHPEAGNVLAAVARALGNDAQVKGANLSLTSAAWNDAKMGEHHAIIPTAQAPRFEDLSRNEQNVYRTVSMQFLAQFYPDCQVEKTKIIVESGTERFAARGRIIVSPGWRVLFGAAEMDEEKDKKDDDDKASLPNLQQGQSVQPKDQEIKAQKTSPPPRYTEGTLLLAMQHIDRFVKDPVQRKKLKNIDGIGRSATRAAIIDTLIGRRLLNKEKRTLISSLTARMLIGALPGQVSDPGLTAQWEQGLDGIAEGKISLAQFEQRQQAWVQALTQQAQTTPLPPPPPEVQAQAAQRAASGGGGAKKYATKSGTNRPASSSNALIGAKPTSPGKTCPQCKKGQMREREVKSGQHSGKKFLGCSNYPECKHSEWPK